MVESQFNSKITFSIDLHQQLNEHLINYNNDNVFTLVDENTRKHCLPKLEQLHNTNIVEIKSGEEHKTIDTVLSIWEYLNKNKGNRKSLFINLGGGLLCDVGGFAASTFKRGMDYLNIPTTLLAQVDASVGGKTGINFMHYKNEIGIVRTPVDVLISPVFFDTLDEMNIRSGFAEMIKHALLDSREHLEKLLDIDFRQSHEEKQLTIIKKSVAIKDHIVQQDPFEKGIRKALNLGHTIGHAFESFAQRNKKALLHGEAVALGLIPELYLSVKKSGFLESELKHFVDIIKSRYAYFHFEQKDIETLIGIMQHDKKNEGKAILFTLLQDFGQPIINQECTQVEIEDSLHFYLNC